MSVSSEAAVPECAEKTSRFLAGLFSGEWQSFDITFTAPVFEGKKLVWPGFATVYHNGVLVHNHESIRGPVAHKKVDPYKPHPSQLPLGLMGHGSKVKFRNIWVQQP